MTGVFPSVLKTVKVVPVLEDALKRRPRAIETEIK